MNPAIAAINKATGFNPGGNNPSYSPLYSSPVPKMSVGSPTPATATPSYDPNAILKQLQAQLAQIYNPPINNAAFSFNAATAHQQALNQAKGQVDPYYTGLINQFNQNIAQ